MWFQATHSAEPGCFSLQHVFFFWWMFWWMQSYVARHSVQLLNFIVCWDMSLNLVGEIMLFVTAYVTDPITLVGCERLINGENCWEIPKLAAFRTSLRSNVCTLLVCSNLSSSPAVDGWQERWWAWGFSNDDCKVSRDEQVCTYPVKCKLLLH
jgi:hypothetical protein